MKKILLLLMMVIILVACGKEAKEVKPEEVKLEEYPYRYSVDNMYYKSGTWEFATGRYEGKYYIGQFLEGVAIGHHKRFLDNGQTLTEGNYNRKGEKDGYQREYYRGYDGQIKSEHQYVNGLRHGTIKEWYPNGQVYKVEEWKNGKLLNDVVIMYHDNGKVRGRINYVGDGLVELYHRNGNLKERYFERNGVKDGRKETFYDDGRKRFVGEYVEGELVEAIGWHGNGQVAIEKKDNLVRMYRHEGSILYEMDLEKRRGYYSYDGLQQQYIAHSNARLITKPWEYDEKGVRRDLVFMPKSVKMSFWNEWEDVEYNEYGQGNVIQKATGVKYNELGLIISSYENDSRSKEKNRINYYYNELGQVIKTEFTSGWETDGWIGYFEYNENREMIASYFEEVYNEDNIVYEVYYANNISKYTGGEQNRSLENEYDVKDGYIVRMGNNNFEHDEKGRLVKEYREGRFEIIKIYNEEGMFIKQNYNELARNFGIVNIRNFEYDENKRIMISRLKWLNIDTWEEKIAYKVDYDENGRAINIYSDTFISRDYPEKIEVKYRY